MITDLCDVQDIDDPLSKVKAGLVSNGDQPVPLKDVHVRAKLLDLSAKVMNFSQNNAPVNVTAKVLSAVNFHKICTHIMMPIYVM